MDLSSTFSSLGIALGLGLLVGLQREQVATQLAGLRTFALITIFGTMSALLANRFGGWVIAGGLLSLTGALLAGRLAEQKSDKVESGVTTEVAALAMFGVGAYVVDGYQEVAIAIGGGIAILLHFKGQLHGIAARLGDDSKSIMQFALISMVILPILPDRSYGPFSVLNPHQVWMMVVLIVGVGLGGYIAYKFFGTRAGLLLAGILGGIISSTATTASYAKRANRQELPERSAALVILLASVTSAALVLGEIGVVAPHLLALAAAPLLILIATLSMLSLPWRLMKLKDSEGMPLHGTPTDLRGAIYFACLYAFILLAITAVRETYGTSGLYVVAAASGLAEVHALALSTAQLVETGRLAGSEGWRIIAVGLIANLGAKAATVMALGTRGLWRKITLPYLTTIALGIALVVWWP